MAKWEMWCQRGMSGGKVGDLVVKWEMRWLSGRGGGKVGDVVGKVEDVGLKWEIESQQSGNSAAICII